MSNRDQMPPFKKPPEILLVDLPSGANNLILDYRNTQAIPERPQTLNCDFCCNRVDRLWFYPTHAFGVELAAGRHIESVESRWGACVMCRPLFEQQDLAALTARVYTLGGPMMPPNLERLYATVYGAISGPLKEWKSGDPFS